MMQPRKAMIKRTIYNGYEPDNTIYFHLIETSGNQWKLKELSGNLVFNDGESMIFIRQLEDGRFRWTNDRNCGIVDTWSEAWQKMPSFVTHPDHFEESELTVINLEKIYE